VKTTVPVVPLGVETVTLRGPVCVLTGMVRTAVAVVESTIVICANVSGPAEIVNP
jgi:hypothetical protein